jgi:hypothetical protein
MMGIRWRIAGLLLIMTLLVSSPGVSEDWNAVEWSGAADGLGLQVWASALREEAFRSYSGSDTGSDTGIAAALAGRWLRQQLDLGLAAQAVSTFRSLPPAIRARLEEGPFQAVSGEVGGQPFRAEVPDLRLELAAAHLLAGDPQGAAALAERVPSLPWAPAGEWLAPQRAPAPDLAARLFQGLIARWLRPSTDDPFELLAEAAGREASAGLVFRILLGRVAERDGYPSISADAFGSVARRLERFATGAANIPQPLPERVTAAGRRLETDVASLCRSLEEQAGIAEKASRSTDAEVEARVRAAALAAVQPPVAPGERRRPLFRRAEVLVEVLMVDRAGKRAFVIWYEGPPEGPQGGQIRLEESQGAWNLKVVGSWIA